MHIKWTVPICKHHGFKKCLPMKHRDFKIAWICKAPWFKITSMQTSGLQKGHDYADIMVKKDKAMQSIMVKNYKAVQDSWLKRTILCKRRDFEKASW